MMAFDFTLGSDLVYGSDAVFSSEGVGDISEAYCGYLDCECGSDFPDYPCDYGLWCGDDGYCHDTDWWDF